MSQKLRNSVRSRMFRATAILASAWSSAAFAQAGSAALPTTTLSYAFQNPEIVSSAQRREERGQDIPSAITAFPPSVCNITREWTSIGQRNGENASVYVG